MRPALLRVGSGAVHRSAAPVPLLLCLLTVLGCSDDPSGVERESPTIRIVFPTEDEYDRDGDGLVDIEIEFEDSGSGVDGSTVEVTASRSLGPRGEGGQDLVSRFSIVSRSSQRAVLEETTDALLPAGENTLTATVSDSNGRQSVAERHFTLPPGDFHTVIQAPETVFGRIGIELTPDGSVGLLLPAVQETSLIPFDPFTLTLSAGVPTGGVDGLVEGEVDPMTNILYLASLTARQLVVLDPESLTLRTPVHLSSSATGISRSPTGLLYASLVSQFASVSVIDAQVGQQQAVIQTNVTNTLNPFEPATTIAPRFLGGDIRFFLPMAVMPGGILVVDISDGEVTSTIDIDPRLDRLGLTQSSVQGIDPGILYLSDVDGVAEVDLRRERLVRRIQSDGPRPKFLSLSPSGQRLFVSAGLGTGSTAESWLIDTGTFQIIQRFPVPAPRTAGENRSVFRLDGQLIFSVRGNGIAVYLNRE